MDIEFGAYVIALRVRRVDNTKMVAEFLFVKVARISLNNLGFSLELKPEQSQAANALLQRSDVLAVLPTRFVTSLIFQPFAAIESLKSNIKQCKSFAHCKVSLSIT